MYFGFVEALAQWGSLRPIWAALDRSGPWRWHLISLFWMNLCFSFSLLIPLSFCLLIPHICIPYCALMGDLWPLVWRTYCPWNDSVSVHINIDVCTRSLRDITWLPYLFTRQHKRIKTKAKNKQTHTQTVRQTNKLTQKHRQGQEATKPIQRLSKTDGTVVSHGTLLSLSGVKSQDDL